MSYYIGEVGEVGLAPVVAAVIPSAVKVVSSIIGGGAEERRERNIQGRIQQWATIYNVADLLDILSNEPNDNTETAQAAIRLIRQKGGGEATVAMAKAVKAAGLLTNQGASAKGIDFIPNLTPAATVPTVQTAQGPMIDLAKLTSTPIKAEIPPLLLGGLALLAVFAFSSRR